MTILSTAYSTRYVTSFAPVAAMRGRVGLSPQGRTLRGWLVGLQLCAALVMVSFIGIIYSQSHYIYHSAYGYDKDSLLVPSKSGLPSLSSQLMRQRG